MPIYTPPTVRVRKHRLWTISEGVTVMCHDGFWSATRNPQQSSLDAADVVYRGGYSYNITDDEFNAIPAEYGGGGGVVPT